jgi:hypothetical protein
LGEIPRRTTLGASTVSSTCQFIAETLLSSLLLSATGAIPPHEKPAVPAIRWTEGQPGCTFSADDDGRYRYGFWTNDHGIVLAVDSQELQKTGRRTEPILTLLLALHYRGKNSLSLEPSAITLEFVKHSHDLHPALDPTELRNRFRADSDRLAKTTEREMQKHPEKKIELESTLLEHQKTIAEMLRFLESRSLQTLKLDSVHPEASGWVYFSARSKWIDDWKEQEEFVLRIPLSDQVIEFPFALPPSEGDLLLRRR